MFSCLWSQCPSQWQCHLVSVVPIKMVKCCPLWTYADPYLNTDAGTMSPFEHGEVFVLDDGGEVMST